MKPGRMNKRVTLQQPGGVPDGAGGMTEGYTDVATVWAEVEPLREEEVVASQRIEGRVTHRVGMWYRPGVKEDMRLTFEGRALDIVSIIDPKEEHKELHLLCREVKS